MIEDIKSLNTVDGLTAEQITDYYIDYFPGIYSNEHLQNELREFIGRVIARG